MRRIGALLGALLGVTALAVLAWPGSAGANVIRGTAAPETLTGGGEGDLVLGRAGRDDLWGGRGGDLLRGGPHGDQLHGGPAGDVLAGGGGDDQLHADDGAGDLVRCGAGTDTVYADRHDLVSGCEVNGRRLLRGGALATFDVVGERFRAWVTNRLAIWDLLQLRQGRATASIPNGRLLRGPGRAAHNAPHRWHLDAQDIAMAEFTIELCDAVPSYVDRHVVEFVTVVKRYCPWSARLLELRNYTGNAIPPPAPPSGPPWVGPDRKAP